MSKYAADTSVSTEQSRAEIERTLKRYGATRFGYMSESNRAVIMFEAHDRRIRFDVALPDPTERRFTHTPGRGQARNQQQAYAAWEQACRQKWRALNLVVKAKLEAVESGISEFEEEFLAWVVLPSGQTVSEAIRPNIEIAYQTGELPALMPGS